MAASPSDRGGAVVAVLLVLALLRVATAFVPSMWAWGVNVQRFLPPWPAWVSWTVMLATLVPGVAAAAAPALRRAADRLMPGASGPWLWAAGAALLVWLLPDRTWFTGDFLLRQGAAETGALASVYTQSLPLERFVNQTLPQAFGPFSRLEPNVVTRLIEALAAAGLAWIAGKLAREWALAGSAALVAAATIVCGGYLTFFTGLGKPAALMCMLAAAALLGATRLVRTGRGGALLGCAVAGAFLLHRSGLALAPLWIVALMRARGAAPVAGGRSRLARAVAVALPLIAALIAAPALWRILTGFDLPRHVQPGESGPGGLLARAFAPLHLVDLANLLLFYTPAPLVAGAFLLAGGSRGGGGAGVLAPAAGVSAASGPGATAAGDRAREPGDDRALPVVLAVSFVPLLLFIHPLQGIIRDLEVFAPAGIACAALGARVVGGALHSRRLPAALAPALLAAVVVPAFQWLVHFHDPALGYARARAVALEAPVRPELERARLWDLLAYRAFRERRWERALEASEQSVRLAPHPRAVIMLAIARTYRGDYRGAESLYVGLAERTPDDPLVWVGLGGVAVRVGDSLWSARALARLNSYPAGSREARQIRRHLEVFPEVWPGRSRTAAGGEANP